MHQNTTLALIVMCTPCSVNDEIYSNSRNEQSKQKQQSNSNEEKTIKQIDKHSKAKQSETAYNVDTSKCLRTVHTIMLD